MKKLIIFFYIIVLSFSNILAMDNPFLNKYDTEFEIPPFSKINNSHFMPAFLMGIDEHNREIASIINNPDKPSFENVIIALEKSGTLLDRTGAVFFNLSGSTSDEEIQNIEKEISPVLSEHYDSISLNPEIFQKIKYLWDNVDDLNLSSEERKILEERYKNFIRNGALLEGSAKERYSSINQEISKLSVKFSQYLLAETNNFEIILTKDDLDGLPDDIVILAKEEADKKFGFLLKALSSGCPPHGGIAFGLDRIVMLVTNTNNIRDVIAFPKTQSAACLLTDAPSTVEKAQLDELKIESTHKED